jgi:hypothetical protein
MLHLAALSYYFVPSFCILLAPIFTKQSRGECSNKKQLTVQYSIRCTYLCYYACIHAGMGDCVPFLLLCDYGEGIFYHS